MLYLLMALAILTWTWAGVKTWSYVVDYLDDHGGRLAVVFGFFSGLFWPLTYSFLSFLLFTSVLVGGSLEKSITSLKKQWNKDGN